MRIQPHLTRPVPPKPKPWPHPDDPGHPVPPGLTRTATRAIALTGGWPWALIRIGIAAVAYAALGDPYLDVQPPAVVAR